jgi:hypothetical protein
VRSELPLIGLARPGTTVPAAAGTTLPAVVGLPEAPPLPAPASAERGETPIAPVDAARRVN